MRELNSISQTFERHIIYRATEPIDSHVSIAYIHNKTSFLVFLLS